MDPFIKEVINNDERQLLLFSSDSNYMKHSIKNNLLTAFETRYFSNLQNIKLLYLSACQTGTSDLNEFLKLGYQGFVNNFLEKGVKSVIATRWKVSDKYSVDFANKYYENLTLLKDFQRAFFETKKYFFNNNTPPYLWTSYVFVQ
jgi:CHAT domain-containing protein